MAKAPLLSPKQVAERLSVGLRQAQKLMLEMEPINISSGTKNKCWRVRESALEAWLQRRTKQPDCNAPELRIVKTRKPRGVVIGYDIPPLVNGKIARR